MQKLKFDMLSTRVQLQTCILFSEMGKYITIKYSHEQALEHARVSCKQAYNMIFDIQLTQYQQLISVLNKTKSAYAPNQDHEISCEGYENLINNIIIIDQVIHATKDLRQEFVSK